MRRLLLFVVLFLPWPTRAAFPEGKAHVRPEHRQKKAVQVRSLPSHGRHPARKHPPLRIANLAPRGKTELERGLQESLDHILRTRWLARAQNGVFVLDTRTSEVLYAHNPDRPLNPASNVKLVSTLTALDALGTDFAYSTRLVGPAPDADGVVAGDVYVLGAGDPTLRPAHLWELAETLRQGGVRTVHGDVLVSPDEERDALGQPTVGITVVAGAGEGDLPSVTVEPDSAFFVVDTLATSTSKGRRTRLSVALRAVVDGTADPHVVVEVSGTLRPLQTVRTWREVPKPSLYLAHTLRAVLLLGGIEVTGRARVARESPAHELPLLAAHQSVSFSVLAGMVNKPSSNFLADRMISTVGAALYGGAPSVAKGVRAMEQFLARLGFTQGSYLLENGSGLSRKNRLSARQIAQILLAGAGHDRIAPEYLASLAIAGRDGTLRARFAGRASEGWMRGKTGTLSSVLALSGFVSVGGDDTLCFAILTNGFRDRKKLIVRAEHAAMVDAMYRYLRRRRDHTAADATTLPTQAPILATDAAPPAGEARAEENDEPAKDDDDATAP